MTVLCVKGGNTKFSKRYFSIAKVIPDTTKAKERKKVCEGEITVINKKRQKMETNAKSP